METVFPVVPLDYPSTVQINYGDQPFVFDFKMTPVRAQGQQQQPQQSEQSFLVPDGTSADLIPLEILVDIFAFAVDSARDALQLMLTCHWWNSAVMDSVSNPIWQKLSKIQWPYLKEFDVKVRHWAQFYKTRKLALGDYKKSEKYVNPQFIMPIENCAHFLYEIGDNAVEPTGPIDDAGLEWERKCPLLMGNLSGSLDYYAHSFSCQVCDEDVYKVWTTEELLDRTQKGQCVLYFVGADKPSQRTNRRGKHRQPSEEELYERHQEAAIADGRRRLRVQNRGNVALLTAEQFEESKQQSLKEAKQSWATKDDIK